MRNDPTTLKFLRAAKQRLTAAEFLLNNGMALDSTYLAGYGVECGLKALLLARTASSSRRTALVADFRGRIGHDFEKLSELLRRRNVNLSTNIKRHLRTVASWSTDLRYEARRIPYEDAASFFSAARAILAWVEKSL